jgi:hypothetical protein
MHTVPHVLRVHRLKTRVELHVLPVLLASTVTLLALQDVLHVQQALTTHPLAPYPLQRALNVLPTPTAL